MGALHAGHESLIEAAKQRCDVVIVTIFVNPRQFDGALDLAAYPRTQEADLATCERLGADFVVTPALGEMWPNYPAPTATTVSVAGISETFEGAQRPGHFDGVASVVAKIFAVTGECTAFFGEKDFQQLAVIRQMVRDLALAVTVMGCPIVRDDDGLALSSRNARLSIDGRRRALGLSRALGLLAESPALNAEDARALMNNTLLEDGVEVAYAEVVNELTLEPFRRNEQGQARAIIAGIVDGVRLLDNGPVTIVSAPGVTCC